ncbi:predicted protein [Sclerotinia sclerotiorum 1980 UF-70]|uniref:Uncharacterized protein n=1 Tax=Sclerotinia sclerotiorum (strain ATCC 18683 / 1980 / Ss-1) TaxID=665079 RepID=A7F974_SCLS1|nr:predicted protein [Sclerotinia sclerotiorum 1980 UF-70]EDO00285.1 predicted protein [Sclerotinia sclerotiorum 1980 UF-70]
MYTKAGSNKVTRGGWNVPFGSCTSYGLWVMSGFMRSDKEVRSQQIMEKVMHPD